jgi:hypothetical protein
MAETGGTEFDPRAVLADETLQRIAYGEGVGDEVSAQARLIVFEDPNARLDTMLAGFKS